MSLKSVFEKIPVIVFKVFKSLLQPVVYRKVSNTGFDDSSNTDYPLNEVLIISTSGFDISRISFYNDVQPEDKLCFIRGVDVSFVVNNDDQVIDTAGNISFVKGKDVDAANALYILLLRGVQA